MPMLHPVYRVDPQRRLQRESGCHFATLPGWSSSQWQIRRPAFATSIELVRADCISWLSPEWARDGLLALWNLRKHLWDLKVVGESGAGSFLKLRGLRATTSLLALQARDWGWG